MTAGLGARRSAFGERIAQAGWVIRRVIGVPDYQRYLAHRRARHPDEHLMSLAEFTRDRQCARYETPGGRCC